MQIPAPLLAHTGEVRTARRHPASNNFEVYLLETANGPLVLKCAGSPERIAEMEMELAVLQALSDHAPFVPRLVARDGGDFLFTRIPGENIADARRNVTEAERHRLMGAFAAALRRLHAWQPDLPRPIDVLDAALERAAANVAAGRIEAPFDTYGPYAGADPAEMLAHLKRLRPEMQSDPVFGHGDYCLPNVMVAGTSLTGVIDWSRGGYMDRRIDLAGGVWTIRRNLREQTDAYIQTFLHAYGYFEPAETLLPFEALWHLQG